MYQTNITSTTLLARQVKVRTLQYKVAIFLFAFLLFAFRPQLTGMYSTYQSTKGGYESTIQSHQTTKVQHANVLKDLELLKEISNDGQKKNLIQCYNSNCTSLPENIATEPNKSAVKAYLQLQKETDNSKFTLDQKKLLIYLNEFLIKSTNDPTKFNGSIKSISFGGGSTLIQHAISVPTNITISFTDKEGLLGFLRNVEQYVSPTFPMLAVVNSVTYDIINSDSSQDVSVGLNIYMLD